jgi:hypothetical protein
MMTPVPAPTTAPTLTSITVRMCWDNGAEQKVVDGKITSIRYNTGDYVIFSDIEGENGNAWNAETSHVSAIWTHDGLSFHY